MENEEEVIIQESGAVEIYQQDKAQIDVQISTAKAYPRSVKRSIENAIAVVTMDKETAQTCTYSVPRGGKAITGPSVHLAKVLAQCWGNIRVEAKVIGVSDKQLTSQAVCLDLENNLAIKVEVKRSIMTKTGRMNDDMITVTGNAANSIALRNAILNVVPRSVVDKVYNAAKQLITGDVSDQNKMIARRKQVFDALKETYGVSEKEILSAVGKAAIDHVTVDDIVVLIGIGTAIKDGDTTVELAFKTPKSNDLAGQKDSKESKRIEDFIANAKDLPTLEQAADKLKTDGQKALYEAKYKELSNGK